MNENLNLRKILKDCPKGTEFYSRCLGIVKFEGINDALKCIILKNQKETVYYKENGVYYYADEDAEIDLFPSKDQRDWSKWQRPFKDGDVVYNRLQDTIGIVIYDKDNIPCKICDVSKKGAFWYNEGSLIVIVKRDYRFATEKEKQRLFNAIESNGYKWNFETKNLEKLVVPKFKVGDIVQDKDSYKVKITEVNIENELYGYESLIAHGIGGFSFNEQDNWKLAVKYKFKVGDTIRTKNGLQTYEVTKVTSENYSVRALGCVGLLPVKDQDDYKLIPNKFDPKTLKPFDKVLVRDHNNCVWDIDFFGFIDKNQQYEYRCCGCSFKHCIPYNEDTEHLLGTNKQAPEFYVLKD